MSAAAASPARKPRHDKRRARNRSALVEAALALVDERGSAGLTAASVAMRAGLHKQAFYAHFKNLDECLAALAEHLGRELNAAMMSQQLVEIVRAPARDRDAERRVLFAMLDFALARRTAYALLLKERYSDGPLGQTVRWMITWSRRAATASLWVLAQRVGIDAGRLHDVEALAHLVLEMALDGYDRILQDDTLDPRVESERVLRYVESVITGEFIRLMKQP